MKEVIFENSIKFHQVLNKSFLTICGAEIARLIDTLVWNGPSSSVLKTWESMQDQKNLYMKKKYYLNKKFRQPE